MSTAVAIAPTPVAAADAPATLWKIAWRQIRRNRLAMMCLGIILLYACVAAYTEGVYWYYRLAQKTAPYRTVEFDNRFAVPSLTHLLGTDATAKRLSNS